MSGHVKGKWAYMSPEQVMGEPVDRRSDIFSLGIVLWEIATGLRLFKADSEVRTVMRITSGKVVEPSSVVPGFPEKLERIALRALSRRPMDRYPTASAMADELDEFVALIGRPVTPDDLARLMRQLFAEAIETKEELLRREASKALGGGTGAGVRAAPPAVKPPQQPSPEPAPTPEPTGSTIELPRRRSALLVLAAIVGTFVIGLVATLVAMGERDPIVRIVSDPAGATVVIDGVPQPRATPAELRGVRAGSHELELSLEGFETRRVAFDATGRDVELRYELRRAAAEPSAVAPPPLPTLEPAAPARDAAVDGASPSTPRTGGTPAPPPQLDRPRSRETAYLNLLARPWAKVWINGRPAGQTPLVRVPIPAGPVVVRLQPEGAGESQTIRFRAEPGETISRQIVLTR
jgi:serine/threonine-protein kinase